MKLANSIPILFRNLVRWFTVPQSSPDLNRRNFINVQIDAIGVGLASAANPFLPAFLLRLGASTYLVGLLTSMPALTGLILSIPLGQFLQSRRNIVPWFSLARLTVLSGYALTGLITIFLPELYSIYGILGIWALATIPQTILSITFTVVMNSIAGPSGRYELMTHRWSILGLTNALTAVIAGQVLDRVTFPLNYQILFITLSAGGLVSYYFSSHLVIPVSTAPVTKLSIFKQIGENFHHLKAAKPFISFSLKRFVFLSGTALVTPLLPVYFLRELQASESNYAFITIATNVTVILGYFLWTYQSRTRGSRVVLLATTFGVSLYPILTGLTDQIWPIILYAGMTGIFQAGLNLVLFDELMKRIPVEHSASFVSVAQGIQYLSSVIAPSIGALLSETIGIQLALILGGLVSLSGFALFFIEESPLRKKAALPTK